MEDNTRVPKRAHAFFKWYCSEAKYEEIQGDLEEYYNDRVEEIGVRRANIRYVFDVIRCFQPYAWKKSKRSQNSSISANRFNFIQLLRRLKKEKFYAGFNITGLGLGMACCILIILYASRVMSYEKHHEKLDQIYLYGVNMTIGGISSSQASCNPSVGPLLKDYIPGIEEYVRTRYMAQGLIEIDGVATAERGFLWADASIFSVFTHEFIEGTVGNSLGNPHGIVLTESMAERHFVKGTAVGQLIKLRDFETYEVTGVIKDVPTNSHLTYDAILPMNSLLKVINEDFVPAANRLGGGMSYTTYFLFKKGFTPEAFQTGFDAFYVEHVEKDDTINYKAIIDPVGDIYLNSKIWSSYAARNKRTFYGFLSIAVFMLVLASINYINLSTARAESRAREVGVKKVLGAGRAALIGQFLGEAMFFAFASLIVGLVITQIILTNTTFNELIGEDLTLLQLTAPWLAFVLLGMTVIIGLLSGIYPALFMSKIKPIKALSGVFRIKYSNYSFRNLLVTAQMVVSVSAIVLSMLMNSQIKFMLNNDLGFDKENIVVIDLRNEGKKSNAASFKNLLLKNPVISSAAFSSTTPGYPSSGMAYGWEQEDGTMGGLAAVPFNVDLDYFETLGLEIVEGNGFETKRMSGDSLVSIIVNQQFVDKIGWSSAIGKRSSFGRVIGVVKNFHFGSLHREIRPAFMVQHNPDNIPDLLNLKIAGNDIPTTLDFIEASWISLNNNEVLDMQFLDHRIQELYVSNQNQITLNNAFSLISIIISCIGLIGLTTYITGKRLKEIAVRKVFGAGEMHLFGKLFSGVFYKVLLASVIASVLGYYAYENWVADFVYQAPVRYAVFGISFLAVLVGASLISFYQAHKVISKNPSTTLKYE